MKRSRAFSADPVSVPGARRFVLAALERSSTEVRQTAELMVSELATNAVRHVGSDFEVSVESGAGRIRIEVTDHGGGAPRMRRPAPTEPSGRGLLIVDTFAETWGVKPLAAGGKTVWFTLAAARSAAGDQLLRGVGERHSAR